MASVHEIKNRKKSRDTVPFIKKKILAKNNRPGLSIKSCVLIAGWQNGSINQNKPHSTNTHKNKAQKKDI